MYKLLLCWRYLRTRYLALACIISVMLGVATLIVVNSVMSGFSTKLKDRLHGLLSDIVIEASTMEGFADPGEKMARIRALPFLSERIEAMTPVMEVFAIMQFSWPNGERVTRTVHLVGVDPKSRNLVGGFKEHLVQARSKPGEFSFELSPEARKRYEYREAIMDLQQRAITPVDPEQPPPPARTPKRIKVPCGVVLGNLIASYREKAGTDENGTVKYVEKYPLGTDRSEVIITTIGGERLMPVYDNFVVVDYFKSDMSEYDSQYVFVPLEHLQQLRTMQNRVTSIQIKLRDYATAPAVVKELRKMFGKDGVRVETWEHKQGPLLAAISIEKGILNILLFLIIGVAGFGILAIFTMIVAEKTRDIGILKALGASNGGVMKIFLGYGFLLGIIGAWMGTALGLSLTFNINAIEHLLSNITGGEIFNREVYYFDKIPTNIEIWMLVLVNIGAIGIAVVFSVLPAMRAAMLHPVRALRYE
ncbi:MAG: ABC transporter permease [Planctomycetes bacterium]|nr:ABC transporter permease [Planctomycetota bacterium]